MANRESDILKFLNDIQPLYKKRLEMIRLRNKLIKRLPIKTVLGFSSTMRKFYESVIRKYPYENATSFLHAGSVRRINIFEYDVFESMMNVTFEGHTYMAVGDYDKYLRHCFDDYMQLPPEDQRHPYHGFVYYWK